MRLSNVLFSMCVTFAFTNAHAHGLTIHAAEIGVGKFHRHDHGVHNYPDTNTWKSFVLSENAPTSTPQVVENEDQSVTIFFSSLEELLTTSVELAATRGEKIGILNINGHGMPGGMWYPKDKDQQNSFECADWRESAEADDEENYNDYYTAIDKYEILQIRDLSNANPTHFACVTGLPEWQEVTARIPNIKDAFAHDAQIHFLSCVVGLGTVGKAFTEGVAQLLLNHPEGRVHSSLMYGLGDWSIPEGMSFWDYLTDEQLERDNKVYPVNKRDRDLMQKGSIRIASIDSSGKSLSGLLKDTEFMLLEKDLRSPNAIDLLHELNSSPPSHAPRIVRIPGTGVFARQVQ